MHRIAVVIALTASGLLAADVSGKWKGNVEYNDGEEHKIPLTMDLKQDGTTVTGKTATDPANPYEIRNGKVEGSKFTFDVTPEHGPMTFSCTVADNDMSCSSDADGTEIKLSVTREP